jgi:N-acetylglucosaminyldiphosphoundecaprenol N-acetyl-beta-D-mannosaminyltransferase
MVPSLNLPERTMYISILGVRVNPVSYAAVLKQALGWTNTAESRYVCAANVHMLMEAHDSPDYMTVVNSADIVTPDGMPLVWMMRLKGQGDQQRVYGPTLMLHVLASAARENIPIGFYGSAPDVLKLLVERMRARYEGLNIVYWYSPPFRAMTLEEDARKIREINQSGARILFVGLGCPKQEIWMSEHRGKIQAVMLGVGAAFDFHAGVRSQAPPWMQKIGMEWIFRFANEPRRLWRRYLYHNPRFIILAIADLLGFLR